MASKNKDVASRAKVNWRSSTGLDKKKPSGLVKGFGDCVELTAEQRSEVSVCKLCETRSKTWSGSGGVKCGFSSKGAFIQDNWNCATLNSLRSIAFELNTIQYMDDCSIATIPVRDKGWIVLSWYKVHGQTATARLIMDTTDKPLTAAIAMQAITQHAHLLEPKEEFVVADAADANCASLGDVY